MSFPLNKAAVFVLLFFMAPIVYGAACTSNGSGNWNAITWTGCASGPQPADTVTIASGNNIIVNVSSTIATLTMTAGAGASNSLTIQTGKALNVTGALTFSINQASSQTIVMQGTGNLSAGSIVTSTATGVGVSSITCSAGATGTLSVTGDITLVGSAVANSNGTKIDFGTTSTACNVSAGTVHLTGAANSGGLLKMGTGTLTLGGTMTGSGASAKAQIITGAGATIVLNNATISTGTVPTIGAGTNITSTGSSFVASTFTIITWGALDVQSGTLTHLGAAGTYTNLQIENGATFTIETAITGSGNYLNNGVHSGTGTLVLNGSGTTIDGTGTNTLTGLTTVTNAKTILNTANLSFAGAFTISAGTTTNNGVMATTGTFTDTGGVVNNSTITAIGSLTGTGGWLQGTNAVLNADGNGATAMAVSGNTDFHTNYNVVYYANGVQTCKTTQYQDLVFLSSGTKTCTPTSPNLGAVTVGGTSAWTLTTALTVSSAVYVNGGTLTTGGVAFTASSATTVSAGTLSLTNNAGAKTFVGLVTVNGSGTLSGASTNVFFQGGISALSGTVSITGTSTFNTNAQSVNGTITLSTVVVTGVTLNNNGNVTVPLNGFMSGTGQWTQGLNSNLTTGGANANAMGVTTADFSTNVNTVTYNGAAQTVKPTAYSYLVLGNSGAKTMTSVTTVNGDLTLSGSATATLAANLAVDGEMSIAGGILTTGNFTLDVTSDVVVTSTITHSGSAAVTFHSNLIVNGRLAGAGTGTTMVFEDVIGTGSVNLTANTFEQRVSANQNFGTTSGAANWLFTKLIFSNGNGTATPETITTETGGTGTITASTMTIGKAGDTSGATTTLDPGDVTWTLTAAGTAFILTANLGILCDPGTCPTNTSTIYYTGATATTLTASGGYYNLFSTPTIGAAITYTAGGPITVAKDFLMNPTAPANNRLLTLNLAGALTVGRALMLDGVTSACSAINTSAVSNYAITTSTLIIAAGVAACADNLIANGSSITITGTGTPLTLGVSLSTYTYGTSTIVFTGNGATIPALSGSAGTNGYYNLYLQPNGSTPQVLGAGTFQINNDLRVGDGTNEGATGSANDPTITVINDVIIAANASFAPTDGLFTSSGSWTNNGTFTAGASTVTFAAGSIGQTITSGGGAFFNVVFNGLGGGWTLQDPLSVTTVTFNSGTLDTSASGNYEMTVAGDWNHFGGTLVFNVSTVTIAGVAPSTSTLRGSTTFYNLNCVTPNKTISMIINSTQTIANALTLTGASGNLLKVRSTSSGNYAYMNSSGTNNVTFVNAQDNNAVAGETILAGATSNGTNTVNWLFGSPTLSVTFSTGAYNFGLVNLAATTISTLAVVVNNAGNVTETYSLSVSTTGAQTVWGVDVATPTTLDNFALFGLFNSVKPSSNTFVMADVITSTPTTSTNSIYAGNQDGIRVPIAGNLNFWMELFTAHTTTTNLPQQMNVVVSASTP